MAKLMQSANLEQRVPRGVLPFQRQARYTAGAGLRMLSRLQTTLEPQRLLEFYLEDVGALLGLDSLHWSLPALDLRVSLGRGGRSRMIYNLTLGDMPLGELTLARRLPMTEAESRLLEQSLGLLIHPLNNAVNYQRALLAARRDALTGLGNRAALDESLARELDMARRHKEPLSMILLDVDRFKEINDGHGHPAGDGTLRWVAEVLRQAARQSDLLFRFGGDEFVVLMSRTDRDGALAVAERIRRAVGQAGFCHGDRSISVRVSLGVAQAGAGEDAESLFARADQALLEAKRLGRDQVGVAA